MLDKRAQSLLKTLIERYIAVGQPIGSQVLSQYSGLDLSAATIRNVMSDLEDLGLIISPHTSAGRIPTAQGYRFFVDTLLIVKPLQDYELSELEGQLHARHPQRLIDSASRVLSSLTHCVGLVLAPRRAAPKIRQVEFLSLSEQRTLLIIVTMDGDVQNRIFVTKRSYSPSELTAAANAINQHFAGLSFDEIRDRLRVELVQLRSDMMELMSAAMEVGNEAVSDTSSQYVLSGEKNLLDSEDLSSNMQQLRQLFSLFEKKTELVQLLDLSHYAEGVHVFIGGEAGIAPLDECSVITAAYEVDGEVVGSVGVIGPTRMAYERVIPIVDITAKLLSSALSQG